MWNEYHLFQKRNLKKLQTVWTVMSKRIKLLLSNILLLWKDIAVVFLSKQNCIHNHLNCYQFVMPTYARFWFAQNCLWMVKHFATFIMSIHCAVGKVFWIPNRPRVKFSLTQSRAETRKTMWKELKADYFN